MSFQFFKDYSLFNIKLAQPVSPGDSQGQRLFDKPRGIEQNTFLIKPVEALAAPGFQR